jgi:hypothetical protein
MYPTISGILLTRFRLYQNTKCSDLTVYCRGKTYPVHRAVLRSRSDFFDGACRNLFSESQRGWIDLSTDDPEAVEHMINCKFLQY